MDGWPFTIVPIEEDAEIIILIIIKSEHKKRDEKGKRGPLGIPWHGGYRKERIQEKKNKFTCLTPLSLSERPRPQASERYISFQKPQYIHCHLYSIVLWRELIRILYSFLCCLLYYIHNTKITTLKTAFWSRGFTKTAAPQCWTFSWKNRILISNDTWHRILPHIPSYENWKFHVTSVSQVPAKPRVLCTATELPNAHI